MRKVWLVVKAVAAAIVVIGLGVGIYIAWTWDRVWDVPMPDLHASTDPAAIARGEYLVFGPSHCVICHARDPEAVSRFMTTGERPALEGGSPLPLGPLGTLYSKNLTPDPESGIGRFTDPQIARMLRHAVRPDGKASIADLMPFSNMSDEDIVGILSFLRTQPPVRHVVPENEWTLFGKVMKSFVPAALPKLDGKPPSLSPKQEATIERGEYLALSVANCGGCHTPYNPLTGAPTGPAFSGGIAMEPAPLPDVDPRLWYLPPNITPLLGSALTKFPDQATFVARFKVGGRQQAGSPMPWEAYSRMTPEDIGALYQYLRSLPPSGAQAPTDPRVRQGS